MTLIVSGIGIILSNFKIVCLWVKKKMGNRTLATAVASFIGTDRILNPSEIERAARGQFIYYPFALEDDHRFPPAILTLFLN